MGWDITYHPLGEDEIKTLYFAAVENPALGKAIAEQFNVPEFHHENLARVIATGSDDDMDGPFGPYHGMNLAVMAGHLRRYWYVRGSALSFLYDDPDFSGYFSDFRTLVPENRRHLQFDNHLPGNYSAGVYLSPSALASLKRDMENSPAVAEKMRDLFSHGRLEVFMTALEYALENGLGLLEASEVLEPNPLDLNKSRCLSNLHNCDPAGAILYHEAAMEQLAGIQEARQAEEQTAAAGEPAGSEGAPGPEPSELTAGPEKKGFFSRLFGLGKK